MPAPLGRVHGKVMLRQPLLPQLPRPFFSAINQRRWPRIPPSMMLIWGASRCIKLQVSSELLSRGLATAFAVLPLPLMAEWRPSKAMRWRLLPPGQVAITEAVRASARRPAAAASQVAMSPVAVLLVVP
jgi:hypothetical protein